MNLIMSRFQCLVVDDEPVSRKILREFIEEVDFLALGGEAENPLQVNKILLDKRIDLIFLDIQMPKMSGIDFLKSVSKLPPVILTTAYSEYALQGFELEVLDYLLKPIKFERFFKAVSKLGSDNQNKKELNEEKKKTEYFFIKCDQQLERINLSELLFVQAMSNYVIFQTRQRKYITYLTIKGVEEKLPKEEFIRIHKSFLVSVRAIQSIDGDEVKITDQIRLPISKFYKTETIKKISPFIFKR